MFARYAFILGCWTVAWSQTGPVVYSGGVVNAASFAPGVPLAPGSIGSVFGTFPVQSGLAITLGGTQAPVLYAASGQVNFQVPWELAGKSQAVLTVTAAGQTSAPQTVKLAPTGPGLFSSILDSSYRLITAANPAGPVLPPS